MGGPALCLDLHDRLGRRICSCGCGSWLNGSPNHVCSLGVGQSCAALSFVPSREEFTGICARSGRGTGFHCPPRSRRFWLVAPEWGVPPPFIHNSNLWWGSATVF